VQIETFCIKIFEILNTLMQNALINVPFILRLLFSSCLHIDVHISFSIIVISVCSPAPPAQREHVQGRPTGRLLVPRSFELVV
jgi:hypothetical protein